MGVSGCGKSTLASALAIRLGWHFVEGDALHPAANLAKMAAGQPLDDNDRQPFLHNVGKAIARHEHVGVVVACSALKRSYRDLLRSYCGDLGFVLPLLSKAELCQRLQARSNHFMPASLLDSQLAPLELPQADEAALSFDGSADHANAVAEILAWLQCSPANAEGKADSLPRG
jgi:gluconokinase